MYETWYYGVGAFCLLAGVLFAAYKLKPESTRVFVETAKVTVELANDARDDFKYQLDALSARFGELELRLIESERVAREANERADGLQRQLTQEKTKVRKLQTEVRVLRAELRSHDIKLPETAEEEEEERG